MTTNSLNQPKPNPYATEHHPVDNKRYIRIEFYKDGERRRVWPYIARYPEVCEFRGHEFINSCYRHFHVVGAFDTHSDAREAALNGAQQYLAIPDWEHSLC
jgi:hypothetical protein